MNLDMFRPRNESKVLSPSLTENCETFIKQTHKKPKETLEFKIRKRRVTLHLNHLLNLVFTLNG